MIEEKTAPVISALSPGVAWREVSAIARPRKPGHGVTADCLSRGERGASAEPWTQEDMPPSPPASPVSGTGNKRATIRCMQGRDHPRPSCGNVAETRATRFRGNQGGRAAKCAEGFETIFPRTVDGLE